MIIANILFYIFSTLILFSAIMVVTSKNPVHSILFLIFAFFNSAGIFILLGAEFIAMLMVIVYVGAVAVLFLFVVMMMNVNFAQMRAGFMKNLPIGIAIAIVMFIELFMVLNISFLQKTKMVGASLPIDNAVTNTEALGMVLYTDYVLPFQLAGLVLLVAMIGAIVLTHRVRGGVRKQSIYKQVSRTREESVQNVKVKSGKGV